MTIGGPLLSPEQIEDLFHRLRTQNPHPVTALEYKSPFTLLVAVVLSAQTTDVAVNKVTRRLFDTCDTPTKMLALGEERLAEQIRSIGLFKTKAKHITALCRIIIEQFQGQVPSNLAALQSLPGVGRKTANVVLNVAFEEAAIAVDTHVFRVATRVGLSSASTVRGVEDDLARLTPFQYRLHAHHWLILHGRHVCQARKPKCSGCVLADLCRYNNQMIAARPA